MALALPEPEERGIIGTLLSRPPQDFATLGYPNQGHGVLLLTREQQNFPCRRVTLPVTMACTPNCCPTVRGSALLPLKVKTAARGFTVSSGKPAIFRIKFSVRPMAKASASSS